MKILFDFLRFNFWRNNHLFNFSSDQFSTILAISRWSTSSPKVFLANCTISRVVLKTGDGVSLSWNIAIQVSISLNNKPKENRVEFLLRTCSGNRCWVTQDRPEEVLIALRASSIFSPYFFKTTMLSDTVQIFAARRELLTAFTAWPAPQGPKWTIFAKEEKTFLTWSTNSPPPNIAAVCPWMLLQGHLIQRSHKI